jgi:hypothetical protein
MGFNDRNGVYHAFYSTIPVSLFSFREATAGDVPNTAATPPGGLLTADTTPALSGTGSTVSQQLSWAAGNVDQILTQISLPDDFDGRNPVIVELFGSSGATNAFSFTVTTSWDGGPNVVDTATGKASATNHVAEAIIDPADIPDGARTLSIALAPAAHATDAFTLVSARIKYAPKVA